MILKNGVPLYGRIRGLDTASSILQDVRQRKHTIRRAGMEEIVLDQVTSYDGVMTYRSAVSGLRSGWNFTSLFFIQE
jgi:hypothetical protein